MATTGRARAGDAPYERVHVFAFHNYSDEEDAITVRPIDGLQRASAHVWLIIIGWASG